MQIETALRMRREGAFCREIGEAIGKSEQAVNRFFRAHAGRPDYVGKSAVASDILRQSSGAIRTPVEVLFDRDRRLNSPRAAHPNCIVLGDPVVPRWHSNAARR
jgi:hypothetical protein